MRSGIWYVERKLETATPATPKVLARKNPTDEQLAQTLDTVPNVEPERNGAFLIFTPAKKRKTFMLITTPASDAVRIDNIKPAKASAGIGR